MVDSFHVGGLNDLLTCAQIDGLHKTKKGSKYADDMKVEFHFERAPQAVCCKHADSYWWWCVFGGDGQFTPGNGVSTSWFP